MSNKLREQVYESFDLKETDELIEIWKTNDRVEWSDVTFEVIEELLRERIGQIPPQDEPVLEHTDEDGLEDWEAKLLDEENQPDFYDTLEVLSLRDNINKIIKAAVVIYLIIGFFNIPLISMLIGDIPFTFWDALRFVPETLVILLETGFKIAITYFFLKALTHILRILMEMEFRSRKAG